MDAPRQVPHWERRRYRAPREDGALLAAPPLAEAAGLVRTNAAAAAGERTLLLGESLASLRAAARLEIRDVARRYTDELHVPTSHTSEAGPWIVTGHQPGPFHPGVWVKNFAAAAISRSLGGVGLNLIVDNDVTAVPGVSVPAGDRDSPALQTILFDTPRPAQPWESVLTSGGDLWTSFGERVAAAMRPWGIEPIAAEFWQDVLEQSRSTRRVTDCLSAARIRWEQRLGEGIGNAEVPLSRLCETGAFRWFACQLLSELPRFHALHNEILDEYRTLNRNRSRTHPVPDLRSNDGWRESPFWIWHDADPQRSRLLVRNERDRVTLSDGRTPLVELPLPGDPGTCVRRLGDLSAAGWRLRSRALTTTLFARLCLADLFIHGIGGAKYDEMTDQLIWRFYGVAPPAYLTLSGTLRLPLPAHPVTPEDERRLVRQIRDLQYHAEQHLPDVALSPCAPLIAEKQALIAEQHAVDAARREGRRGVASLGMRRMIRLRELNRQLAAGREDALSVLQTELDTTRRELRANAVLQSREYAFILFPEEMLREVLVRWIRECPMSNDQ